LRRIRRGVPFDNYVRHLRLFAASDMERDDGAARGAIEVRLGIDAGLEVTVAHEVLLQGDGAAIRGVEREDIAAVERHFAPELQPLRAVYSVKMDFRNAVIQEKRKRDSDAARRRNGFDAHVAKVARSEERFDR